MPSRDVRPSVRPSRSCILSKRINISSIFSQSGSHTVLFFFHNKRCGNIPMGPPPPLMGTSNAGEVGKNRYCRQISVYRSLIQICITPSVESTPGFFPSASPVMSRLTSSFTCQLISITITTLIIHHSFSLSLQAQNLPFQQILPTLDFFYLPDCLHDNRTGPDLS